MQEEPAFQWKVCKVLVEENKSKTIFLNQLTYVMHIIKGGMKI